MDLKNIDEEIQIKGEMLDPERCRFVVNRPIFAAGGSVQFTNPETAKGTPLAEKLFSIPSITGVMLSGSTATLSKKGGGEWSQIGKEVGRMIRTHLQTEKADLTSALTREEEKGGPIAEQIRSKVQQVLDSQINPGVSSHGGYVSLLDVKGSTIYIQMGGGCQGCGMASVTLKQGVEKAIRQFVPEVTEILDTTDHASGRNPYYAASTK